MEKTIEINGLSKSLGDKKILNAIDLILHKGENIVIMGKSGSGKSVLLKCIVGLLTPDAGRIRLFGDDILDSNGSSLHDIRKNTGYLFQNGAIYDSMSVRENLEFPVKRTRFSQNKQEIEQLVEEALENVGLGDAKNVKPAELSGGMRKRLGLARTLILKPKIIFYDEPTTGLDPVTSQDISELILEIQKKYHTSSLIVTHDMKCARVTANHIKMLKDGKFCAEGSFDELKNSPDEEIRAYFN